ncbi:MAG: LysM peptidoglycan-binding domain-containing protein [Caldilineaceae bacterium]|nr:LysM peptidoglycan-binding domain-containing protein [Caldilineaceae bacterium]
MTFITKCTSLLLRILLAFFLVTPAFTPLASFAQEGGVLAQLDPDAQTVAMAINGARAQAGLPPLALHPLLNLAAQKHVNDMVTNYNYSHTGTDGSNVRQRVQATGYGNAWASENWVSVSSANMAIQWWMNSSIHRGNILNTNWHEYGIGVGRRSANGEIIFVAVFAAGQNSDGAEIVMPPPPTPLVIPPGGTSYTIQSGDTLLSIALRYGVEWPVIAAANGLTEFSLLQIGQVIRLPGINEIIPVSQVTTVAAQEAESVSSDMFVRRYTVQPGDTLVGIANIYGITWQELAAENGLGERSVISVGKEIRIPGAIKRADAPETAEAETVAAAQLTSDYYEVANGDTVISIAVKHGLDWQELLQMNSLTESSLLQLGQKLRVR